MELHHRVDPLLWMDHDVDPFEGNAEEQVGLDDLSPALTKVAEWS
jgi:hypothetical protein